ncbi:bifunctional non-homologous end joining protein LigD [Sphingomonas vulcanisoli]|uniref:DNA ligase (ATP) n=1 Tax=Sphingomonas vulcanisoli TaxID=1658060 RepID=A0ABX0TQN9_9SPHN|nr:DNA ligase D [Sphingomonas vulcanisoli]NIJ06450.1 bifunctional non-homologous end joining protein LigD [Sphingomonas vulcanisoli]
MVRATPKPDPLAAYNAKRDFAQTAEPSGVVVADTGNIFMVQKHDATRLHWDFRLELDGVLKSWAVTRGPSLNPDDKRLAVRTEDHPMGYATFEGTIPKGQYGGGTVMLWDRGTWEPVPGKDPRKTLAEGHLHFFLHGERMKGEWLMIRLKPRGKETHENWLLRKIADEHAGGSGDLVDMALTSVATGRTMVEIAAGKGGKSQWNSNRSAEDQPGVHPHPSQPSAMAGPLPSSSREREGAPKARKGEGDRRLKKKPKGTLPAFRQPQLCTLVDHVPTGSEWIHEVKYDGYRILLGVGGGKAKAFTRTGLDWSDRFQPIVDAAVATLPGSALIDGEVVALDKDGRPSFQALQASLKGGGGTLAFFAFDLLEEDGESLEKLPNIERKARLAALLEGVPSPILYSDHIQGQGEKLFKSLCEQGLEGVVSKRADAPYRGKRTQNWLKIKCLRRQEFVIVGWTPSDKGRGFRSLLLGLHEGDALRYTGKAGTGFGAAMIDDLMAKMKPLERKTPTVSAPRAAVRGAHWITPKLVAEIAFTEFTDEGVLRHPSFIGLREDKPESEVVLESPSPLVGEDRGEGIDRAGSMPARAKKLATLAPPSQPSPTRGEGLKESPVTITNPDRVIYPESGITKGELADYYLRLADPVLQWVADRPVSLVRCPQGRAKHCFFQKHDAGSFGDAVRHVPIREKNGHDEPYLYLNDAKGLLTCVQMGAIEFHGWGSKVTDVEKPDRLVFDLDPDEGLGWDEVRAAAEQLRDVLGEMGLASWPMLSGGKGIHVVVPLDASRAWPEVKDFASRFAQAISEAHPERFTANMKKVQRKGRIFLDWLRNQRGATAVLPYVARARPNAPVAAPVTWDELKHIESAARWTIRDADELLKRAGSKALKGWAVADQRLPDL